MDATREVPSFIGYRPEEAERAARALGFAVRWVDAPPSRWEFAAREARVGRQRRCGDGTLELLRIIMPGILIPEAFQ